MRRLYSARHLSRLFVMLLILVSLSACTRFVYNHADWLVNWYMDDYIQFDRGQKQIFNQQLDELLTWHRQQHLPHYKRFLATVQKDMRQPMSPELLNKHSDQTTAFWKEIMATAMPDLADLFLRLSDEQVDEFLQNLDNEQRKLKKKQQSTSEKKRINQNVQEVEKSLKRFFGKLTDAQRDRIRQWVVNTPNIYASSIQQRLEWQERLADAFAQRNADPQLFRQRIVTLFVQPDTYWPERYQHKVEVNRQQSFKMLSDIQQSLTDKQHAKFNTLINNYMKDIDILQN